MAPRRPLWTILEMAGTFSVSTTGANVFFLETRKRLKRGEIQRLLFRLVNHSSPDLVGLESRVEGRATHIQPVALAFEINGAPATDEAMFGLTGDICSHGLSIYVAHSVEKRKAFVGLCVDGEVHVFLGQVKSAVPMGGGFHRVGLDLDELVPPDAPGMPAMRALTHELRS